MSTELADLEFIKSVSTWDSGGGITIGLLELQDGRVIGISEDVIILYKSMDAALAGEPIEDAPFIPL
jgi:hypothetical protein